MTAAHEGLEPWEIEGLAVARQLAELGVRLFVAPPDWTPGHRLGFRLPQQWERVAVADPAVVDAWQPDWALCAVGDGPVSFIDLDPQPGQDPMGLLNNLATAELLPYVYGRAVTPSGGMHLLVAGLDAPKAENVIPGVDVRAGYHDGSSAGFVFLSPTRRSRKDDRSGPRYPYQWLNQVQIDPAQLAADPSGGPLAQRLRAGRPKPSVESGVGSERAPLPETAGLAERLMNGDLTGAQVVRTPEQGWTELEQAARGVLGCVEHGGAHEAVRDFAWQVARYSQGGLMPYESAWEHFSSVITARWPAGPDEGDQLAWSSAWSKLSREDPSSRVKVMTQAEIEANQRAALLYGAPPGTPPGGYMTPLGYATPGRGRFADQVTDAEGLRAIPPPEPLVGSWLFKDSLAWVVGERGQGKSLVVIDLVCCVAAGRDWHGFHTAPGRVLYVIAEGLRGMSSRIDAWTAKYGHLSGVDFLPYAVQLADPTDIGELVELVAERRYDVVVIDTQSRASTGLDENAAKDATVLVHNLDRIRQATGACVITVHHTARGQKNPRGSSVIEGAADTILSVAKDGNDITVKGEKQKDMDDGRTLALQVVAAGQSVTVADFGMVGQELDRLAESDRRVLNHMKRGGKWSVTELTRELDIPDTTVRRVITRLMQRGAVLGDEMAHNKRYWAASLGAPVSPYGAASEAPIERVRSDRASGDLHNPHSIPTQIPTQNRRSEANPHQIPTKSPPSPNPHRGAPPLGAPGNGESAPLGERSETSEPPPSSVSGPAEPLPGPPDPTPEAPPVSPEPGHPESPKAPKPKADPKPGTKAHARAEAKRQAIVDAAGPDVDLPAAVVRDTSPLEPGSVSVYPIDLEMAAEVLATMPVLTVDVETSGYPVGHELYELRTVQLGDANISVVLDPDDDTHRAFITRIVQDAPRLRAHSATADTVPLAVAGLADFDGMWDRMDDTVIPAKLNDPDSSGSDPSLKKIAEHVLGPDAVSTPAEAAKDDLFAKAGWLKEPKLTTPLERNGWYQVRKTSTTMLRYAGSDVLDTARVSELLPPLPTWLAERERVVAHMVARVAFHGVPIDGPLVDRLLAEHSGAREALSERIRDRYGIDNPGSAQQVSRTLLEAGVELPRTKPSKTHPNGQPSVKEGVLESLRGQYSGETDELITDVLQYRHHNTAIGLFLEPYHERVHRGDGRARPTVYTLGADTGRMSCVRPNFQQLPREGGIRAIIRTDDGMSQIGADFSSVELRVAAEVSGDIVLKRMLDDGLDPHAMAAELVFGPSWTKEQRYMVKRGVFGRIYGGGLNTLAEQMGVPHWTAQKLIDAIDTLWPTLSAWAKSISAAVQSGMMTTFTTYSGRIVHLPRDKAHAAPNYIIQGTARELLMDALLLWRGTPWGNSVMWPVHDEVDAHVPADQAEEATVTLVQCMETTLPSGVQIVAEPSEPSPFWRDAS